MSNTQWHGINLNGTYSLRCMTSHGLTVTSKIFFMSNIHWHDINLNWTYSLRYMTSHGLTVISTRWSIKWKRTLRMWQSLYLKKNIQTGVCIRGMDARNCRYSVSLFKIAGFFDIMFAFFKWQWRPKRYDSCQRFRHMHSPQTADDIEKYGILPTRTECNDELTQAVIVLLHNALDIRFQKFCA